MEENKIENGGNKMEKQRWRKIEGGNKIKKNKWEETR